jgi:hypothetical protein
MHPAALLLAEVEGLGLRLDVVNGKILAYPATLAGVPPDEVLTAELRGRLRAAKAELVDLLRRDPCESCSSTSWSVSLVDDAGERTCHDCLSGRTALRRAGPVG